MDGWGRKYFENCPSTLGQVVDRGASPGARPMLRDRFALGCLSVSLPCVGHDSAEYGL